MSLPASVLLDAARKASLLPPEQLEQACALADTYSTANALSEALVERGLLTAHQAEALETSLKGSGSEPRPVNNA